MSNSVTNYDGSITATPQQLVYPETVEEIQAILRDSAQYPGPVVPGAGIIRVDRKRRVVTGERVLRPAQAIEGGAPVLQGGRIFVISGAGALKCGKRVFATAHFQERRAAIVERLNMARLD